MKNFTLNPFACKQKGTVFVLCFLLFVAFGCGNKSLEINSDDDNRPTNLEGTVWKLAGYVDAQGALKEFTPKDCDECYSLWFDTDYTATIISISKRWKLDLRKLTPPDFVNKSLRCELYNKDEEYYCIDLTDFLNLLKLTQSYSVSDRKLKLWVNDSYLLFIPHVGDHPSTSKRGTEWKLTGMIDVRTGELKALEPADCEYCYKIHFVGNDLLYVQSIQANLFFNLLTFEREYIKNAGGIFLDGWVIDDGDAINAHDDSNLFCYGIDHVKSYELTPDELKFYFVYQEKNYYFNFKLVYQ